MNKNIKIGIIGGGGVTARISAVMRERDFADLISCTNTLQELKSQEKSFELTTTIPDFRVLDKENQKETRQQRRKKERELKKKCK